MGLRPALLLVGLLAGAGGGEPAIRDLSISLDGPRLLASFRLENGFSDELLARIESGLPSGFVYELELKRDRKRWSDAHLGAARLEVVAMYNAVTREFLVNIKHDGRLIESRTLQERADLEAAMTQFAAFQAFTLDGASERERYLIRVRVELAPGEVLGFIPVRRTSSWVESNKVRPRR